MRNISLLLILTLSLSTCNGMFQHVSYTGYLNSRNTYPIKKDNYLMLNTSQLMKHTISTLGIVKKIIGTTYSISDKILSKQGLATALILGYPYFKLNPAAATRLASIGSSMVIKFNGLVAEGIINGLARNPKAVTQLMAILTVKETGTWVAKEVGKGLGGALLYVLTLSKYKGLV